MADITSFENDMGCKVILWRFEYRTAQLFLSSTSLDLSSADAAVETFRNELEKLPFSELAVTFDTDKNNLTVDGQFRLPLIFRNRRIHSTLSSVFNAYRAHLAPLMKARHDSSLGKLIWDGSLSHWTTEITLDGQSVLLSLDDWNESDLSQALNNAKELIENWDKWRPRIREAQIRDLLDLYNDNWRQDGSPRLNSDELLERLSMTSIDCSDDLRRIYFDQDELFTDHIIEMMISPEGEVETDLAG